MKLGVCGEGDVLLVIASSELDISNVDISHVVLSRGFLIIKNEMCSFEIRNVSFSNTKNVSI